MYVEKYLRVYDLIRSCPGAKEDKLIDRFLGGNLRSDGVLLIRMMEANSGHLLTGELIRALWERFQDRFEDRSRNGSVDGFVETEMI